FGPIDYESPELPFKHTDYYRREFGTCLIRRFIAFSRLIVPSALASIKIRTNKIEHKTSRSGKRLVNIDPGYIDMAKLVLASTKDFCHRIYLDRGIFAEITLVYRKDSFTRQEWTYPDYRTPEYIAVFNRIRKDYAVRSCSPHI
ncbi:MAG: DUF4416 family protein, partial [Candidatus Omnitrophica bacterium]|nr:DUF4416 family protein [Candidatus Omnitrophota bacterium]